MPINEPPIEPHDEPSLWAMIALVAGIVATVILCFSIFGYVLGKLVL